VTDKLQDGQWPVMGVTGGFTSHAYLAKWGKVTVCVDNVNQ